jgi:hypothetical protein
MFPAAESPVPPVARKKVWLADLENLPMWLVAPVPGTQRFCEAGFARRALLGQLFPVDAKLQLKINEIFLSVQGESTWVGLPCVFVRLTGCDLRCTYCDTEYGFYEGVRRSLTDCSARYWPSIVPSLRSPAVSRYFRRTSSRL